MHVLWTPSWFPTQDDPFNGSFFKDQVEILRNAGHEVGVCYLTPKSFWQWHPSRPTVSPSEQLVMSSFPMVPKGIVGGDRTIISAFSKQLGREYAAHWGTPDIIHAHSVFPGVLVAQVLAQFWNVPYGITEHRPSTLQSRENSPRTRAIRKAVQSANFRLAVSREFAKELTKKYDAEFGIASLPVPDVYFETQIPKKSRQVTRFVHVSHLSPNKRTDKTIQAFARMNRKYPNTELHVIGGSPARVSDLETTAKNFNVSQSVKFLGKISRERMPSVLAQYDALVLFSRKEAGGTVFAEAQSLGIPVIASATFGGLHMALPNTGMVVPIDDTQALEEAMEKFAGGKTNFASQKIREIARERFSSKTFARKHEMTYRRAFESFSESKGI